MKSDTKRHLRPVLVSLLMYVVLFVVVQGYFNRGMSIAALIPVAAVAWHFGLAAGIAAGLLSLPLNILMYIVLDVDWGERLFVSGAGIQGTLGLIFIGAMVGRMSSLSSQLRAHRNNLSDMVREQTEKLTAANQDLRAREQELRAVNIQLSAANQQLIAGEHDLRQSNEYLDNIFRATGDGIMVTDMRGTITTANNSLENMLGYAEGELVGKTNSNLIALDDADKKSRGLQIDRELFEKGFVANQEAEFIKKDGGRLSVEISLRMLRNQAGAQTGTVAVIRDISERKQAEDEVRNARDFMERVIDSSLDCIVIGDTTGHIIRVNRAFIDLLGYPEKDVLGKTPAFFALMDTGTYETSTGEQAVITEQYLESAQAMIERLFETGKIKNWQIFLKRRDGLLIPAELNIVFIHNTRGEQIGSMAVFCDITDRKKTDAERIRLSSAVEQACELIVIMDSGGTIQYVNPAVTKTLGHPPEDSLGTNPFYTKNENMDQRLYREIWDTISSGNVWTGQVTFKARNGQTIETETTTTPIRDRTGSISGYVSIARDVTRENRLEQQLRQSQKMEAIGTLAGGIAHDFNNILTAIIGYTEMNLYELRPGSKARYNSEQVFGAAQRARDLIKQILTFSRQAEQQKRPVQLKTVLDESVKLLRASIPSTIAITTSFETSALIMADTTQIHQVVLNLCSNASQAMSGDSGKITIRHDEQRLDTDETYEQCGIPAGSYVRLTISDTGSGIDPSIIDRIFEPFYTTKDPGAGTGMGLSVVHGIIKAHDGAVSVSSIPGRGSTFTLYFPRIDEKAAEKDDEPNLLQQGSGSVLFVDDEETLVELGKLLIESLGYRVTAVKNSTEAFKIFSADPDAFDLVITDYTMPGMTGYDLAKKILALRHKIPIILCTGFSESISEEKAKAAGIREFIMKPFTLEQIAGSIHSAVSRAGTRSASAAAQ